MAVPVDDVDFQAGITTILEAMAMGKPVIATHTYGQTDVIEDRRSVTRGAQERARPISLLRNVADEEDVPIEPNGFYVPPKDPEALQRAIVFLLDHPEERARLGAAGRRAVERLMSVDQFAERIARVVDVVVGRGRTGQPASWRSGQTSNTAPRRTTLTSALSNGPHLNPHHSDHGAPTPRPRGSGSKLLQRGRVRYLLLATRTILTLAATALAGLTGLPPAPDRRGRPGQVGARGGGRRRRTPASADGSPCWCRPTTRRRRSGGCSRAPGALEYPADRFDVYVVADNCTDRTAEVARAAGARVEERFDQTARGKGHALRWLLTRLRERGARYDAYVVIDADTDRGAGPALDGWTPTSRPAAR